MLFASFWACDTSDTIEEITNVINVYDTLVTPEYVITDFGAVGDGLTDCAPAFEKALAALPASGGLILIPEGDFLLNNPIEITRNFVTIKGVNNGLRSNIDVPAGDMVNPGGGSKLILGSSTYGIRIPSIPDVNGRKNRISGVNIKNLLISGGSERKGTGIYIQQDNDGIRIDNVVGINLNYGIFVIAADAMIIEKCWMSECLNSIVMNYGIQNMIANCQLGAQSGGVTVTLSNQENFVFEGNHVYPDGDVNLKMTNCTYTNVSSNNFQSYHVGMLELHGDNNLISNNIYWLRNALSQSVQLRAKDKDYGVIRVEGNANLISSSSITCNWNEGIINPVTIRSVSGSKNRFTNLLISDDNSKRVFYVNETTEIFNCVPADKINVDGDLNNIYVSY